MVCEDKSLDCGSIEVKSIEEKLIAVNPTSAPPGSGLRRVSENETMNTAIKVSAFAWSGALLYGSQAVLCAGLAHAQDHRILDGRGYFLDSRYNHGHFYPILGGSVRVLPEGYRPYFFHDHPYHFQGA
jgi:hypothetical protein